MRSSKNETHPDVEVRKKKNRKEICPGERIRISPCRTIS